MDTKCANLQTAPLVSDASSHDMFVFVTPGVTGLRRSRLYDPFHYGETAAMKIARCSDFPHIDRQ